ncbi:MAG TPA: hypothetical protein VK559_00830 [Ferruginibacter sp.]|nr:hypothetical protein [Ferruginibacter sp.]
MRSHQEILSDIDATLAANGFEAERSTVQDEIDSSRTNAEICMNCGLTLLTFQKERPAVEACIGELIKEFIRYCSANGIRVKL